MKQRITAFARLAMLWMGFFIVSRLIFMLYQFKLSHQLNLTDIILPNLLGLRMDAAMTGYWLVIPGLALVLSCYWPTVSKWLITLTFYPLLAFSALIVISDLELYSHWGFRMDTAPLLYTGSEGFGSVSPFVIVQLIVLFLVLMALSIWFFNRWIKSQLKLPTGTWKQSLLMLTCVALLFIPIRSSFRVAPLNTGVVYYHKNNPYPNHAGINVVWNFMKSVVSDNAFRYPENLVQSQLAEDTFRTLMSKSDTTQSVLRIDQPNILLIILEGFTAKVIEPLGGRPNITPNLNKLCTEGILWNNFYASGDRTDKGLISILSGYPAQPKTSIIKYPNKTQFLPSLPKTLRAIGYHTSFVYGGDIGFANMESYLTIAGFNHITEDDDFDLSLNVSKWGVHDEFVFERLLNEMDTAKAPFFKTILTLSSHEPFDVPSGMPEKRDQESLFLNACTYTDASLGRFIGQAKQKPWWKNTLVVITADHGHPQPGNSAAHKIERFKIPMLWLGGALNQARLYENMGSQTDIVATLLGQLHVESNTFHFSKDLLNANAESFAVYAFNNGFGYVSTKSLFVYDFDLKNYIDQQAADPDAITQGRSYMQQLFKDYNKR